MDLNNARSSRTVPIKPLIKLKGVPHGKQLAVLKDDGCNTNVISKSFVEANRHLLTLRHEPSLISHSDKDYTETSEEVVVDTEIELGTHSYRSNWIVANCRYDLILGMPWHEATNPSVDYVAKTVTIEGKALPSSLDAVSKVTIGNIGVKKFRSLLRNKKKHSETFVVLQVNTSSVAHLQKAKSKGHRTADTEIKALLEEFHDLFTDELPPGLPPKRSVDHVIEVEDDKKPPNRPIFQLSPAELLPTKDYLIDLLNKGKIRPNRSLYGAPLFFVKQKGKLRGVIDYRALNSIRKPNNTPIPRTDEMFDRLGRAVYFSKLDLKSGFQQIRVAPEDVEKTAFNTKYGHYEFLVMPMGLRNSPATIQTLRNEIFYDEIDDYVVIYLDDILIYSNSREEHLQHLRTVLTKLRENRLFVLFLDKDKYHVMETETEFLGLMVGTNRIKIGDDRKEIIKTWPVPTNLTEWRGFIGLLKFFRRFIKNLSETAAPLTNLTRKGKGIKDWDESCDSAFATLKERLVTAPIMTAPNWERPFICHTDASQLAVGGTLTQRNENGEEKVISYISRGLSPTEENYSANDRELLGLVYFLKRFRCYLEGSSFEVRAENQVLKTFSARLTSAGGKRGGSSSWDNLESLQ